MKKELYLKSLFLITWMMIGLLAANAHSLVVDGIHDETNGYTEATAISAEYNYQSSETIAFRDTTVEAICVANWDVNGDGKLSYDEASAVTNLNDAFRGDSSITSFDELQYFTGLTSIGSFENCINLESIVLPETITSIGGSFKNCSSLSYLKIPRAVTYINFLAFENCPAIVEIADGNEQYASDENAVYGIASGSVYRELLFVNGSCDSLIVEPTVSGLRKDTFRYASKLKKIVIEGGYPGNYENYISFGGSSNYATFKNCPLKEVVLNRYFWDTSSMYPKSYHGVFNYNQDLEKATLGGNVTTIYDGMFEGCSNLSTVIAEGEITYVGRGAFKGTKWAKTGSENGVKYLGNYAAAYDEQTADVSFRSNTSDVADGFFYGATGLGSVQLPTCLSTLPKKMFYNAEADEIIIPNWITRIAYDSFIGARIRRFIIEESDEILQIGSNCDWFQSSFNNASIGTIVINRQLQLYVYHNGSSNWDMQYAHPFGKASIGKVIITKDLDLYDWFNGCQVAYVEFADDISSIGAYAFMYYKSLNNDYNYQYYDYTFYFDEHTLNSIVIPGSVTSIGYNAFYGYRLSSVTCLATTPPVVYKPWYLYSTDTLYVPAGCKPSYEVADFWKDFHEIIELAPTQAPGDVNGDGYIAINDVTNLIDILLSGGDIPANADVNGDGNVSIKDVTDLIDILLSGN